MLARVPREVSDAWHDRVPARLHLAWRVKRRGAMKSAHWAPPQRGCAAPPLQGPNPTPNPNPTQHGHGSRCPRSPGSASGQRGGASSRRCPAPPLPVLLRRRGTCEHAGLPRKSNSMLHASEATATYWADAAPSAPGAGCCAAHFLRPAIEVAPVTVCMAACNRVHGSL